LQAAAELIGAHALILANWQKGLPEILHAFIGEPLEDLPREDFEHVLGELTLGVSDETSLLFGDRIVIFSRSSLPQLGPARLIFAAFPASSSKRTRVVQLQRASELLGFILKEHEARVTQSAGEEGLKDAFDRCDSGMLLVRREGAITFANAEAQRLIAEGDGLRTVDGTIQATTFDDNMKVRLAIERTFRTGESSRDTLVLPIKRSAGRRPLMVAVQPLSKAGEARSRQRVLLNILDPERGIDGALDLECGLLGLTRVETRLTLQLAQGMGLTEAAAAIGVKEQTARTYLKSIFGKTGTNRQADLVRFLLTGLNPVRCTENNIRPQEPNSPPNGGGDLPVWGERKD
jgi:DNA-binding CsgD family transcriptional regulator